MSDLFLDSLEIKNFRLFKHLEIERLGRVNLIVGKNNVGKSTLLEALWLYAKRGAPLYDMLIQRDLKGLELARSRAGSKDEDELRAQRYLIYNRPELRVKEEAEAYTPEMEREIASVGPLGRPEKAFLLEPVSDRKYPTYRRLVPRMSEGLNSDTSSKRVSVCYVLARGWSEDEMNQVWHEIEQTHLEDWVLDALRIISSELEDVRLRRYPEERLVPVARLANQSDPEPLRSLGEGMNRLFGLTLALINAQDGLLLVDEIESGLHYSVQPDMWRLIFETAAKLNVQVFATTHSLDCLRAFESAASERGEDESLLISLRRHRQEPEKIVAVLAGKDELATIVHSHNENQGALEEFARMLIPAEDDLWAYAETCIDGVPEKRFKNKDAGKALVHTWLAWQKEPGKPVGQAITKGFLDPQAPAAQKFVAWVRRHLRRMRLSALAPPAGWSPDCQKMQAGCGPAAGPSASLSNSGR